MTSSFTSGDSGITIILLQALFAPLQGSQDTVMASRGGPAPRHFLRKGVPSLLPKPQRRWARVHDVRFVATLPQSEKVFEKYKDKLERRAKEYVIGPSWSAIPGSGNLPLLELG